jgi:hypothetical protein
MGTPKALSPLVVAAAAVDDELRGYDELAQEARRTKIDGEKGLKRVVAIVQESAVRNDRIQEKLKVLVTEIEAARTRQVESLNTLLEAARTVEARAVQHESLMHRFAELGESAERVNAMAIEISERKRAGAPEAELLERLNGIQLQMATVVAEAEALATRADEEHWPDLARQANAVRQQVLAAKNKLSLAHKALASGAPS